VLQRGEVYGGDGGEGSITFLGRAQKEKLLMVLRQEFRC
jgi:hypothetical protein